MELIIGLIALILITIIGGIFLNFDFWQGYRNTKYFDELEKLDNETLNDLMEV